MKKFGCKTGLCAFFALCCAVLFVFGIVFTGNRDKQNSYAQEWEYTHVNVPELWGQGAERFNKASLQQLYKALTNKNNATLEDVKNLTKGTTIYGQEYLASSSLPNAEKYRINNYKNVGDFKKEIYVTIDGIRWAVTWLSRTGENSNDGGDVVLTLWCKDMSLVRENTGRLLTSYHNRSNVNGINVSSSSLPPYPMALYSFSYIRNLLNGYENYASDNYSMTGTFTEAQKAQFSCFEDFRTGALSSYIASPRSVKVQEFESSVMQISTVWSVPVEEMGECTGEFPTLYANMSYGTEEAYFQSGSHSAYTRVNGYGDWADDKLWLPSIAEVSYGYSEPNSSSSMEHSLWELTEHLYCTYRDEGNEECMLRDVLIQATDREYRLEAHTSNDHHTYEISIPDEDMSFYISPNADWHLSAAPAFHLNLSEADAKAVDAVANPSDVSIEYSASNIGITSYNAPWFKEGMSATYVKSTGGETLSAVRDAGTYNATISISDPDKVMWTDGTNGTKTCRVTVAKRKIKVNFSMPEGEALPLATIDESNIPRGETSPPTVFLKFAGTGNNAFNGDENNPPTSPGTYVATATLKGGGDNYELDTTDSTHPVTFNFEYQQIAIPKPVLLDTESVTYDGMPTEFAFENFEANKFLFTLPEGVTVGKEGVIATDAGTYTIGIAPKEQYVWSEGGYAKQEYTITIDRAPLRVGITSVTGGTIGGEAGSATDAGAQVTVFANVPAGDRVKINITATPVNGGRTYVVYTGAELIGAEGADVQLDLSKITAVGEYRLNVTAEAGEGDNKNYDITIAANVTLTVRAPENRVNLIWFLAHNGKTETIAAGQSQNYDYEGRLYYDGGKEYRFSVNTGALAASGFAVDTDYNEGAYVNGYSVAAASVAGSYTTSVKLKTTGGADAGIYSVNWTIEKALYDFTNVKWMNNGRLYYTGAPQSMMLDPATVPGGLLVNYNSGTATEVTPEGEYYTATIISFEIEDKDNYILPLVGDDTTYIYNGSEPFEWSKQWRIDKTLIAERWSVEHRVDGNGRKYDIYVISNEDHRAYVDHLYFETNRQGVKLSETPISPEDIEVTPKTVKYYICEVTLKANAENGFEITGGKYTSLPFEVGHNQTEVRFEADESMRYTGEARELELRLVEGTLSAKAYEIVYYERNGTTALDGAPVNVGEYRAEVTLKAEYAENYYIEGDTVFEFAITPALIAVNWNRETTPPRLTLPSSQAKYVEYLFYDMLGNSLTFADLTQGEYRIRARIKAEYAENYDFAELNADITEYEEFSVTSSDKLNDPNDPMGGTDPRPPVDMQIVLPVNWNNGMKPPRLTLDALQASLVEYVFYNAEGAEIGFEQISVGTYGVKAKIKATYAAQYDFFGGTDETETVSFTVVSGEQIRNPNEPIDPNDPNGNGGTTGDKPTDSFLPENLPLWQLIVGGVSVVLILLFSTKIAQVRGRTKKAKAATAYSFGGIGALLAMDGAWLGLPQIGWTAIALALVGIAALLFILYLILNKKCLAAEAVAAEAEKRRQAEREEAKEEERRRRDEEFKLMMASMMNGQQSQPFGGDIKELVGEVVASAMQALPAPSAEMQQMLEQQQQMIEAMMTSQQQLQALPAPDNDRIAELEARMAEQQRLAEERAAEQQRIADERLAQQQAMMLEQQRMAEERAAEQQRLSEERMERLMMQLSERETNPSSQTIVQTDDGLRDILEKHGEMLDALMNKENVNKTVYINNEAAVARPEVEPAERLTLREAYALMPKNYQKLFDQVEKYILAKSETVESEGKFAITFKCKAKQFVKLCIKKGFPTMQYTTEGEQLRTLRKKAAQEEGVKVRFKMSELQVYDESTYEVAKGVIDLRAEQVDRDVEYAKEQRLLKRKANKTE